VLDGTVMNLGRIWKEAAVPDWRFCPGPERGGTGKNAGRVACGPPVRDSNRAPFTY
jgi:hypothetical protein